MYVEAPAMDPEILSVADLVAENRCLRLENARLRAENAELRAENAELRAALDLVQRKFLEVSDLLVQVQEENRQLKQRVLHLEEQLQQSQRASKRQAAPFRRNSRIPESEHKKPGRKEGHPPAWRPKPEADAVVDVPLSNQYCPRCGDHLVDLSTHEHFVTDIPPVQPTTTRFVTHSGRCARCRTRWASRHPDLPTEATVAAGSVIGHNAIALAAQMRVQMGVSLRKLANFLSMWFNLPITHSALLGCLDRAATALAPTTKAIQLSLRSSETVCADETGWRVSCESAWAWVFTNATHTLFVIKPSRAHTVALAVLGPDFAGFLQSDCYAAYDALPYDAARKPKCAAHFLKDLRELASLQTGMAARFPQRMKSLLQGAIALKDARPDLSPAEFEGRCQATEQQLDRILSSRISDPKNLKLAKRLRKHKPGVLTFLREAGVEPTNNQAERQLRPLVIQRKLSGGSRSDRGAQVLATLASVFATACQQGLNFSAVVLTALQGRWTGRSALPP